MVSLRQLAQQAIDIQDTCNLSGLAKSWGEVQTQLREVMPTIGTQEMNHHPINKMWAYKLYSLACGEPFDPLSAVNFEGAYTWCQEIVARTKCRFCKGDEKATACECI